MAEAKAFSRAAAAPPTLLTAALYFACSLSLLMAGARGAIAVFCCADAVLLSALLLRPTRSWWRSIAACMIAVFAANLLTSRGVGLALVFAVGNMATPLAAATLMRRIAGDDATRTDTPASVAIFVLVAGLLAPALGALVGGAIVHRAFGLPFPIAWIEWFAAEAAGILLGTPLLLMLWKDELWDWVARIDRRRSPAAVALLLAVVVGSLIAFHSGFASLLFLPSLLVIVAAFCIGRVGAAVSVLIVAVIGSSHAGDAGQLALVAGDAHLQILFLHCYLAVVLLTALPVAASLEESRRLQEELADSEMRYRAMAEHSADLVAWVDPQGRWRYVSPASRDMLGLAPERLIGKPMEEIVHPDDVTRVIDHHAQTLASAGDARTITYRSHHQDGRLLWMEARTRAMFGVNARLIGVQWTIRDVTAHKSIEAMLSEAANSDPLTGLANRRAVFTVLARAIVQARATADPLCVSIIDLDHFKRINDSWGHETGDTALRMVAKECQKVIRQDDLLARLGGEEFALVMPATDLEAASRICERVRVTVDGLAVPVSEGGTIGLTLSAGLTALAASDNATGLVRAADRALYVAKRDGRNCIQIAARDAGQAISKRTGE
jgi:diguanylate cyclase (GGDEF)-like protein/PAS domain S-box-containing protein